MAESRFDPEELEAARPRRGVPLWFWGCGGGCLLAIALSIGAVLFVGDRLTRQTGPEVAWPIVARVLPFAERPADLEAGILPLEGLLRLVRGNVTPEQLESGDHALVLQPKVEGGATHSARTLVLLRPRAERGEEVEAELGLDAGDVTWESLEFELQGRQVTGRHAQLGGGGGGEGDSGGGRKLLRSLTGAEDAELLVVDLTGSRERPLIATLTASGGLRATPEALVELLAPFDVWGGQ